MKVCFLNWRASYEISMVEYLAQHNEVTGVLVPRGLNRLRKKLGVIPGVSAVIARYYIRCYLSDLQPDDLVVCNDSAIFKDLNPWVIAGLKCRKVLLLRNTVTPAFVARATTLFDTIYTFEAQSARALAVGYLPQFIPLGFRETPVSVAPAGASARMRCFFLGRDKGRIGQITALAQRLQQAGCDTDFTVVRDSTSQGSSPYYRDGEFDYTHSLACTQASDVVMDIVQQGQTGWTLRILEALYLNKKVITNNLHLRDAVFYNPARFFIIGHHEWAQLDAFLSATPAPVERAALYAYSPDSMLQTLLQDQSGAAG